MIKYILSIAIALSLQSTTIFAEEKSGDSLKRELTEEELDNKIGRMGDNIYQVPEGYEFSAAEVKMWLSDHLDNISQPTRLLYEFKKSGSYEEGFEDTVHLEIQEINEDGTKNTNMQFFTGERKQLVRPENVTNVTGNPVLGVYMQGDVFEMDRYTGGSWRYFLKSIKTSIHDEATVEPIEFEFGGETVNGEKVYFTPYMNDPRRRQFEKFAGKSYEFIFSDQIPGKLYRIKTVIPAEEGKGKDEPLIEEILTLTEVASS